jgi:hypothetical protein
MSQEENDQPQQLQQDTGASTTEKTDSSASLDGSKKTERSSPHKESKGARARRVEPVKDEQ